MLTIIVPGKETYDEEKETFGRTKDQTLTLEHSLISISKWESKWHKPFIKDDYEKTYEETIDYIKCMTLNPQSVDPSVYSNLTQENLRDIKNYINNPMTATTFSDINKKNKAPRRKRQVITSEVIYYRMFSLDVPMECQKWHLNRLLTLLKVCNEENKQFYPKHKKSSRAEIYAHNKELNEARRAKYHTKG